ncbi:hypothetical protein ES703_30890 [subsurface metagenome]
MLIERIEDKKYKLTLTDKEADMLADCTVIDFARSKQIAAHLGDKVLFYMMESSQFPHAKRPSMKVTL